jgi:uncharacterized protein (DUF1800 family)
MSEESVTTSTRTDVSLVAHLMRRAAFGAPTWKLEQLAERPYEDLVDELVSIDRYERPAEDLLERFNLENADEERYAWTAKRWYYRMINSPRLLEDKVALMWHNRFATAASKVSNARAMAVHIEMLRDNGMGNFKTLLQKLSRDPAMIWWLDQQTNHNGEVNENFGRELLELFSMGRGNYNEVDVRSAAEAFSGWTIDQTIPRYPNGWYDTNFVFREDDHDHQQKHFLGDDGDFNGDDIIDRIVTQPAAARFVATTLYRFFVADEPDGEAIETLSDFYFQSNYEIGEMIRAMFLSDYFKEARFTRVRWPVEHVTYVMKLTGQHTDPYERGLTTLTEKSAAMGQELLNPPTVEGWHIGREWIDSAFLIERVNFATERLADTETPGVRKLVDRLKAHGPSLSAEALLDAALYELGCVEVRDSVRTTILEELGESTVSDTSSPEFDHDATRMFQFIAASPDFQLA